MEQHDALELIAQHLPDRSTRGLVETMLMLIRDESLEPGSKLPTVRAIAARSGISASAVADAWRTLVAARAIETHRRGGSQVIGPPTPAHPQRYERLLKDISLSTTDLSRASTDAALWPDPAPAFAWAAGLGSSRSSWPIPITEELFNAVAPSWPFESPSLLAVNGGLEGFTLALRALVTPGDRILVEEPTEIILLDVIESLGCTAVGIPCDDYGPIPGALANIDYADAPVFVLQSGPTSPTGRMTTQERMRELAEILETRHTKVIECCANPYTISGSTPTLGILLPGRVMHVRWYGRAFGSDILVGVAGGPTEWVDQMWLIRGYHCQWTSRFLQNALAFFLNDSASLAQVDRAREVYDSRRTALVDALRLRGVATASTHGTSVWVPVPREDQVRITLAREGYAVQGGSDFFVTANSPAHIRIAIAEIGDSATRVAELVAVASARVQPGGPSRAGTLLQ